MIKSVIARVLAVSLLVAAAGPAAAQQAYPNKPIRFIVPYPPGGSVDPLTRLFAGKLTEAWGQQVIADNRPGGNTIIGTEALAKSPADGYTILLTSGNHVINALLIPKLPYDAFKDFAPVATLASTEYILVLHPSIPANNLREFIALAKSKPGQLNYGSVGSGGISQLGSELFCMMTGIKMQRIPYKGSAPLLVDLVGGQLNLAFNTPISSIPHIKAGKLKPIAISGDHRMSALPRVPTFTEAGLPGFEMKVWYGVYAPAGTPKEIIDKLSNEFGKIVAMPDMKEKLANQGLDPFYSGPEKYAALIQADRETFAKVIKAANITVD